MPSRCALGGDAGLLLDRPLGPVLSEYTCNVIRKSNTEIDLMCPFVVCLVLAYRVKEDGCVGLTPGLYGFWRGFHGSIRTPETALFK